MLYRTLLPVLALALSAASLAQPVSLQFVQARFDGEESAGLDGTEDLVISPDGRFLYATSYYDDAVTVLERDPETESLTFVQSVYDEMGGVSGLFAPIGLTISADGAFLYVAADRYATVLARDATTGRLTFVQTIEDEEDGALVRSATDIVISPDGDHVYIASDFVDTLTIFARNATTGRLSVVEALENEENGVVGLDDPSELRISPDGAYLYAANGDDDYISIFERAPATGRLSYVSQVTNGQDGVDGIGAVEALAFSADGQFLYATGRRDDALAVFSRDAASGALTPVAVYRDGQSGVDGLAGANGVALSADGAFVYAVGGSATSAFEPGTLAVFARDASTGMLTFVDALENTAELRGAGDVVVAPDGGGLYVASFFADAVSAYDRDPTAGTLEPAGVVVDGTGGMELNSAREVAISLDGRHVYVVSEDDGLNLFERDAATGALAFVSVITRRDIADLSGPIGVEVSRDGQNVYVAAQTSSTLLTFARDAATGQLQHIDTEDDGVDGVDGLGAVRRLSVSPDGAHVYAAGNADHALSVFTRDPDSGELTFVGLVRDGQNGVDGLRSSSGVEVSPDGLNVYATGRFDNAVAVFSRDPSTGNLTFVEFHRDGENGVDGLENAESVRVSPDGRHVIVAAPNDNALALFSRDASTGALTFIEAIRDGIGGTLGDGFPWDLAISPDGTAVFVASSRGTLASFARDAATGQLTPSDIAENESGDVIGLRGARQVIISPDGRHEYVTAATDDAVVVFANSRPVPSEAAPGGTSPLALSLPAPNPATRRARLSLTLSAPQSVNVEVFDALGRRVAVLHRGEALAGTHEIAVDVAALPSGVYTVRASTERGSQSQRLVVVR